MKRYREQAQQGCNDLWTHFYIWWLFSFLSWNRGFITSSFNSLHSYPFFTLYATFIGPGCYGISRVFTDSNFTIFIETVTDLWCFSCLSLDLLYQTSTYLYRRRATGTIMLVYHELQQEHFLSFKDSVLSSAWTSISSSHSHM